mmetsp:Transcript_11551/g.22163  ORF Transcript_11551/g.22163 Transcript_11551/m.22163 type:complete len:226 (-) Transcript_11551:204-881(-)
MHRVPYPNRPHSVFATAKRSNAMRKFPVAMRIIAPNSREKLERFMQARTGRHFLAMSGSFRSTQQHSSRAQQYSPQSTQCPKHQHSQPSPTNSPQAPPPSSAPSPSLAPSSSPSSSSSASSSVFFGSISRGPAAVCGSFSAAPMTGSSTGSIAPMSMDSLPARLLPPVSASAASSPCFSASSSPVSNFSAPASRPPPPSFSAAAAAAAEVKPQQIVIPSGAKSFC